MAGMPTTWVSYAEGKPAEAIADMRTAADLQDKVGQGEVDIPAREMLGDILLESGQPKQALTEYRLALKASPNRFNGLYNAGLAAEASGDKLQAANYYRRLLTSTGNGSASARPEFAHMKSFVNSTALAVN
jgi:tetratricopeptide (TPR) repeat protein